MVSGREIEMQEFAGPAFEFALYLFNALPGLDGCRAGDGTNNDVDIGFFVTAA